MRWWFVAMSHSIEESMQVVKARSLYRFASPALVHEVVELAAAARQRGGRHARAAGPVAPVVGVRHHLANNALR